MPTHDCLQAKKDYDKITAEFSKDQIHTILQKYGSVQGVKKAIKDKKKEYYKK